MNQGDLITLTKAAEQFGVTRVKMTQIVKSGLITVYVNPRDKREKLVDVEEVREALNPRPRHKNE